MLKPMDDQSYGIIPFQEKKSGIQFLVIKHAAGHWGFPKGHPEKGEEPIETAKRELAEETGIADYDISPAPMIEQFYAHNKNGQEVNKKVTYFLGKVNSPEVKLREGEITDFAWCSFDEALERLTHDTSKDTLKEVNSFLQGQR